MDQYKNTTKWKQILYTLTTYFFQVRKKLQLTWFFHLSGVLSCTNQSRNSTKQWGFRLETRRRLASRHFFRTQLKRHCSAVLCAKPCGKRLLLSPEKSLEGTLYSVPSFGGHIVICHDVTVYPILVMARTGYRNYKTPEPSRFLTGNVPAGSNFWT